MITGLVLMLNWNGLLERHGTVVGVLALAAVFASGVLDAAILKKKDWACATWFLGSLYTLESATSPGEEDESCFRLGKATLR